MKFIRKALIRLWLFAAASLAAANFAAPSFAQSPQPAAADKAPAKRAAAPKAPLLDINSASEEELRDLKGIGDKRAADIIENRPYKGKDELVQKKIIPQAVYDGIKDKIIAKQN